MTRRILKCLLPGMLLVALLLLSGCAVVYYHRAQHDNTQITEFGLLGLPKSAQDNAVTGGLLPLYRSTTPAKPQ